MSSLYNNTNKAYTLNTGAKIPAIGLGTWKSGPNDVQHAVNAALRAGYRHIDVAAAYGNETEVGLGIRDSGVPREEIWLTTKLHNQWHQRIPDAIDGSLEKLGTDYVDLYLIHWPCSTDPDDSKKSLKSWDYVDTWREMQKLLGTGKVRNIGVSNFGIKQLERLLHDPSCKVIPAVNQIELHPNHPSPKLVAYNNSKGIHSTGYSCLGSTDSPLYKNKILIDLATRKCKTVQQILIMWGLQRGWSVIPKSVNKERIRNNFDINGWELTADEMEIVDSMKERFKVCDGDFLPDDAVVFYGDDE